MVKWLSYCFDVKYREQSQRLVAVKLTVLSASSMAHNNKEYLLTLSDHAPIYFEQIDFGWRRCDCRCDYCRWSLVLIQVVSGQIWIESKQTLQSK